MLGTAVLFGIVAILSWPNRLADRRYGFYGVGDQVAVTEPNKHNAIHGFLRWRPWPVLRQSKTRVTIGGPALPHLAPRSRLVDHCTSLRRAWAPSPTRSASSRPAARRSWDTPLHRPAGPDGRRAELWIDASYPSIELYTGSALRPARRRTDLSPQRLPKGGGMIRLGPGQAVTTCPGCWPALRRARGSTTPWASWPGAPCSSSASGRSAPRWPGRPRRSACTSSPSTGPAGPTEPPWTRSARRGSWATCYRSPRPSCSPFPSPKRPGA
jgi:hypothetical protein